MKTLDILIYTVLILVGFLFGRLSYTIDSESDPIKSNLQDPISKTNQPTEQLVNPKNNHLTSSDTLKLSTKTAESKNHPINNLPSPKKTKTATKKHSSAFVIKANQLFKERNLFDAISLYNYADKPLTQQEIQWFFLKTIQLIQLKIKQKKYTKATEDIEEARRIFPNKIELIHLKVNAYLLNNQHANAMDFISREVYYIQDDEEQKKLLLHSRKIRDSHIELLIKKGLTQKAKESYEEAISEDPYNNRYYFELAILCLKSNQLEKAENNLRFLLGDETYGQDAQKLIGQINDINAKNEEKLLAREQNLNKKETATISIPLVKKGNSFYVKTKLNEDLEVLLLIDTGASLTTLSKKITDKLGYSGIDYRKVRWFKTAGGDIKMSILKLKSLRLNHIKLNDFTVSVDTSDALHIDGLLGMNFLRYFNFTIDQKNNQLILKTK